MTLVLEIQGRGWNLVLLLGRYCTPNKVQILLEGLTYSPSDADFPVVYTEIKSTFGLAAYPRLIGNWGTIPTIITQRYKEPLITLLALRKSLFDHNVHPPSLE
ncbi:MAG: hypothetical protein ACE5OP_00275 [Candidatus Glassbacteria bacterium]